MPGTEYSHTQLRSNGIYHIYRRVLARYKIVTLLFCIFKSRSSKKSPKTHEKSFKASLPVLARCMAFQSGGLLRPFFRILRYTINMWILWSRREIVYSIHCKARLMLFFNRTGGYDVVVHWIIAGEIDIRSYRIYYYGGLHQQGLQVVLCIIILLHSVCLEPRPTTMNMQLRRVRVDQVTT